PAAPAPSAALPEVPRPHVPPPPTPSRQSPRPPHRRRRRRRETTERPDADQRHRRLRRRPAARRLAARSPRPPHVPPPTPHLSSRHDLRTAAAPPPPQRFASFARDRPACLQWGGTLISRPPGHYKLKRPKWAGRSQEATRGAAIVARGEGGSQVAGNDDAGTAGRGVVARQRRAGGTAAPALELVVRFPRWRYLAPGWQDPYPEEFGRSVRHDLDCLCRRHGRHDERRRPLGDNGVWRLVRRLTRKEYAYEHRQGKLKVLNLQRQGITRQGAGYIARWLSVGPIRDEKNRNLVDVERLPTAAHRNIFINLEGNPIGYLGVRDLERAVESARLNGIKVKVIGGGSVIDLSKRGGGFLQASTIKLGPIEYTRRAVEMKPWRLPVVLHYSMDGTYLVMKSTLAATGKALNKGKIMGSGIIIVHLAKD
ncbi:hypothetical protein THAOC_11044, partial [Thalassiosira oceanica]